MNPADFVSALYGATIGDPHAAGGVQSGSSSYATLEWPGVPLDPGQYGNIWASDNQTGSPEALENFTSLVDDDVPALSPLYQPTGISLPQIFALILQATVPPGPIANTFANAQASFAGVVRGSLQDPQVMFHPSWPVPRTWCDAAGESGWTTVSIGGASPVTPPPPPANLRPLLTREALLGWRVAAAPKVVTPVPVVRSVPHSLAVAAPAAVARPEQTQRMTPALTRATLSALRPQVPQVTPKPATSAMSAATLARLDAMPGMRVAPRPIIAPTPVVALPPPQPVTATQLGATFRYKRVSIQRQWIDATIFRLPGWSIGGVPAGAISNGKADSNPGMLPLSPAAFIAVKDVSISGSWSDSDKTAATAALSGSSIASFGPFALTGGSGAATFDGTTLKVPGIQIIAWICEVMPMLPPA
jgi:hypothetical protein